MTDHVISALWRHSMCHYSWQKILAFTFFEIRFYFVAQVGLELAAVLLPQPT